MKDATFLIAQPALLASVVQQIEQIPMEDRDTKGDLYEYMLSKLSTAGTNGQFRTPRHIIKMMVQLLAPGPRDIICDPACGTGGFLVAAAEYLRDLKDSDGNLVLNAPGNREHFNREMFHGFDFDATMLRIGSMNLMLHGIEDPKIEARDSLSEDYAGVEEAFTMILANPPFKGSVEQSTIAKDLSQHHQNHEDGAAVYCPIFAAAEDGGTGGGDCAGWGAVWLVEGPQGAAPDPGGAAPAGRGDLHAVGGV
jgi:type I restriction enzyme M protein